MTQRPSIEARLFDGQSSRPRAVRLSVGDDRVLLEAIDGSAPAERLRADDLRWHEPLGRAVRRVDLPGGRVCEVATGPGLSAFLAATGHAESAVTVWQGSAARAVFALVVLIVVAIAGYRWGLPLTARLIAHALPQQTISALDGQLLDTLDRSGLLAPTTLDGAAVADIEAATAPLLRARNDAPARLHFRSAEAIGANAFALPGGDIVVTDALVALAPTPQHVAAVIAHELGHVEHRHGLRNLIQASMLAAVIGAWTGDFGSLATAGATGVLSAAYSRDFELDADNYGAALLERSGSSPVLLADMLDALSRARRGGSGSEATGASGTQERGAHWSDYLSSHPPTPERIARLRDAAPR